jgi:MATE family multidrug resistance protein
MRDDRERGEGDLSWPLIGEKSSVKEEVKKQLWLSGPLIAVSLLQFCLQVISVMFVGHLGSLPLSAASIATSFASVTGFSFLVSFSSLSLSFYKLHIPISIYS